ncbi:hypothetical protein Ccrd_001339 [Cynara cardunculus var. scolymus]|uniref:Uncharacterized protein n=1 Tax=Cynara cardunculus var. scolymus TaxID=59895 RepID=A0A118JWX2_CYNCS|nr:hypothetical protein Ccrd_001339 [Cynara cardunculus var. scolymus]
MTVEDMDIVVRAHLHGWKMIFLNDVVVLEKDLAHQDYKLEAQDLKDYQDGDRINSKAFESSSLSGYDLWRMCCKCQKNFAKTLRKLYNVDPNDYMFWDEDLRELSSPGKMATFSTCE